MNWKVTEIIKKLWMHQLKVLSQHLSVITDKNHKKNLGAGNIAHIKFQTFWNEFRSTAGTIQFCSKTEIYARY